ncbi:hypothetical protein HU200_019785 [Digitaria exilis]|uniref:F-box domain-containing protein n=1 Tax=Digitaria exilis TaxID=1010633 RepID=A0A835KHM0_9POAL|nr:hypothetical protein HU200_019785 [Digitaria exilis]
MAPRRGRPPPELTDDVIREILLRLPPSEPAHLVRAALVCRRWRRLLADRGFLRLHRAFHGGAPPLLGFLPLGAPATAEAAAWRFSLPEPEPHAWLALDARHGRVLLHSSDPKRLVVWDPITGDHHKLPLPAHPYRSLAAAVLCAAMDGCDHLDCHGGPFLVAFAATTRRRSSDHSETTWVSVFSSTDGAWGGPTSLSIPLGPASHVATTPGLLADGALYFTLRRGDDGVGILKYDIVRRSLSVIDPPFLRHDVVSMSMAEDDGGGGGLDLQRHFLHLWACRAGDDDGWVRRRVIDLDALLPAAVPKKCAFAVKRVSGFAEGADTIFVSTNVGT